MERLGRERPIVSAELSYDGASDAVRAADSAQRIGGKVLALGISDGVVRADRNRADAGRRDATVLGARSSGNVEPAVDPLVAPVCGDHGGRIERRVGVGIAAE